MWERERVVGFKRLSSFDQKLLINYTFLCSILRFTFLRKLSLFFFSAVQFFFHLIKLWIFLPFLRWINDLFFGATTKVFFSQIFHNFSFFFFSYINEKRKIMQIQLALLIYHTATANLQKFLMFRSIAMFQHNFRDDKWNFFFQCCCSFFLRTQLNFFSLMTTKTRQKL
jgi:hypothetical protein